MAVPADPDGRAGVELLMSGRARPTLLLVALAVVSVACRDAAGPEPVFSSQRAVYAAFEVGSPGVTLLAEGLTEHGSSAPLRGAEATVSGTSGSVALTEAPSSECFVEPMSPVLVRPDDACYTGALPQPAGTSEALALEMMLPDGGRVRGSLVTPGLPVASIPPDSQTVTPYWGARHQLDQAPRAIVPITLHSAPGATRVDIVATVAGVDPSACRIDASAGPWFAPQLEGKHDWYLFERPDCRPGTVIDSSGDWIDLDIHVIAMENNYAGYMNHMLGNSSIDVTRAGFGLEGAVGVFGATATTVLSLRLLYGP
jgi:hypothetical protein